jgi:hypothetical protein
MQQKLLIQSKDQSIESSSESEGVKEIRRIRRLRENKNLTMNFAILKLMDKHLTDIYEKPGIQGDN